MQKYLVFTDHAERRMFKRSVSRDEVREVLLRGEVIQEYPDDTPWPARLMLAWVGGRPLHVVAADAPPKETTFVITAYEPDPQRWNDDFTEKRKK